MARKPPPIGRRFKKGEVHNPKGAAAHDPIKRIIKKLTVPQLEEVIGLVLFSPPEKLKEEAEKDPTILKTWIAAAAMTGIKKGDLTHLTSLIDRVVGRVKERIEVSGNMNAQVVLTMPANGSEKKE